MSSTTASATGQAAPIGKLNWAGYLLGFALGGFFDGILLHQILQWHHLLSGVPGETFRDIRVQIVADGVFHLLMYIIALIGLVMLWQSRASLTRSNEDRVLVGNALIGFGVWHIMDALLFHWTLGLHHIRMDSENWLLWDILWVVVFGVAFVVSGWRLRYRARTSIQSRPRNLGTPLALVALTLAAAPLAALPPRGVSTTLVVFQPGTPTDQIFDAFTATGSGIVWADPSGILWAVDLQRNGNPAALYQHGALLVSRSSLLIGCFPRLP